MPNSLPKSVVPQLFTIRQSRLRLHGLVIIHSLAAIASFSNGLPLLYKFFAVLSVISSAIFYGRDYKNFQPYYIRYNEAVGWQLAKTENNYQVLNILPTTVLTAQIIVLHFRLQTGKKQSLVIVNDALETEDYRSLLVELKISGLANNTAH